MESTQDFKLPDSVKEEIVEFCLKNRISVKTKADDSCDTFMHAPLAVIPSPFSKDGFERVTELQVKMNTLINNLMENMPRVRELLADLGSRDEFIGGLIDISKKVDEYEPKQKGYLGILRSDYMYDDKTDEPKLIEYNTIASSFGPLAWGVNQLHKHLISKYKMDIDVSRIERAKNPHLSIVESLKQAYDLYFDVVDNRKLFLEFFSKIHLDQCDLNLV